VLLGLTTAGSSLASTSTVTSSTMRRPLTSRLRCSVSRIGIGLSRLGYA